MNPSETLLHNVRERPSQIALIDKGVETTYQELFTLAEKIANSLEEDLSPEARIALFFEPSLEAVASTYAALMKHLVFVPISPQQTIKEIVAILNEARPQVLLSTIEGASRLRQLEISPKIVTIESMEETEATQLSHPPYQVSPEELGSIFFTSGSTGTPKGVMTPRHGWTKMLEAWDNELDISKYKNFLVLSGFNFSVFFDDMMLAFFSGGTMHLLEDNIKKRAKNLVKYIRDHQIDYLDFTPAYVNQVVKALQGQPYTPNEEQLVVVGSDSWFMQDLHRLRAAFPKAKIINSYGLTESVVDSGILDYDEAVELGLAENDPVPIGHPFGETEFFILDEDNQPVVEGQEGELCIASAGLTLGYLNPKQNIGKFDEFQGKRIVRTGDLVVRDNGITKLVGRKDRIIKIQGKRVDLNGLQQLLRNDYPNFEFILTMNSSASTFNQLICFVGVGHNGGEADFSLAVEQKLQELSGLPGLPLQVILMPEIPRKPSGKTDFIRLRDFSSQEGSNTVQELGNDPLFQIFSYHIGPHMDPDKDIFLQGADSLMLENIMMEIEEKFNRVIPHSVFYSQRTFTKIASFFLRYHDQESVSERTVGDTLKKELEETISTERKERQRLPETSAELTISHPMLTGGTGFLGAYLLHELLSRSETISCLVRCATVSEGHTKLENNWNKYFPTPFPSDQVHIIPGDFTRERFGLSDLNFDELSSRVDGIIHAGYWINFLTDFEAQRPNVKAMDNLMELANVESKPFLFISTSTASLINSDDPLSMWGGYEMTKLVNERKLEALGRHGVPIRILSPSIISPEISNPRFQDNDFFAAFVRSCSQLQALPDINWSIDLFPVDELAHQMVSRNGKWGTKTVFTNASPLNIPQLSDLMSDYLQAQIKVVSFDEWILLLTHEIFSNAAVPLRPFISGLKQQRERFFETVERPYNAEEIVYASQSSAQLMNAYLNELTKPQL